MKILRVLLDDRRISPQLVVDQVYAQFSWPRTAQSAPPGPFCAQNLETQCMFHLRCILVYLLLLERVCEALFGSEHARILHHLAYGASKKNVIVCTLFRPIFIGIRAAAWSTMILPTLKRKMSSSQRSIMPWRTLCAHPRHR